MKDYQRVTPRDKVEMLNFNGASESMTRFYNYAIRCHDLEDKIESGELCDRDEVIDRLMKAKDTSTLTDKEMEFFIKHNEAVRKETARKITEMLKAAKGVVKVHFEAYDELIENISGQYGIELFGKTEQVEDKE